jgi:hypothetical protein
VYREKHTSTLSRRMAFTRQFLTGTDDGVTKNEASLYKCIFTVQPGIMRSYADLGRFVVFHKKVS